MYSSVKFLSPMVTGGFPTPGPLDAAGGDPWVGPDGVLAAEELLVDELELFEELPHAASAIVNVAVRTVPAAFLQ
jgi:hypothetical protein